MKQSVVAKFIFVQEQDRDHPPPFQIFQFLAMAMAQDSNHEGRMADKVKVV